MSGPGVTVMTPVPATPDQRSDMAERTCSIEECERPVKGHGWCSKHYQRWQKFGDPLERKRAANGEPAEWLRTAVVRSADSCIPWPYAKNSVNYGSVNLDGVSMLATHAALMLSGSPRPAAPNDCALHSCDNPPCVNPRHLRWGTAVENAEEMVARGRSPRGQSRPNHRLTDDLVRQARELLSQGVTIREVAASFGVGQSTIQAVASGKTWTHVRTVA